MHVAHTINFYRQKRERFQLQMIKIRYETLESLLVLTLSGLIGMMVAWLG